MATTPEELQNRARLDAVKWSRRREYVCAECRLFRGNYIGIGSANRCSLCGVNGPNFGKHSRDVVAEHKISRRELRESKA